MGEKTAGTPSRGAARKSTEEEEREK